jgi:hypothetical protein
LLKVNLHTPEPNRSGVRIKGHKIFYTRVFNPLKHFVYQEESKPGQSGQPKQLKKGLASATEQTKKEVSEKGGEGSKGGAAIVATAKAEAGNSA